MTHLEKLKKELEGKLHPSFVGDDWFLDYKVKGTQQKVENMKKNSCRGSQTFDITLAKLKKQQDCQCEKVGKLEKIIQEMHHKIDEGKVLFMPLIFFLIDHQRRCV